ncbi:MAG: hypothetical protein OXQ94_09550 [Gemmatimonadota bacterium]|nr:hypothetical protein [Gemmatimonadota bacterium]MDE2871914.1 hypothetical protein [Gemmatimonadota bacterium]
MHGGLELDDGAKGAPEHAGKQLARGLYAALGPAPLLHQERRGRARQLGRNSHLVPQHEAPSRHLRPIADVEVLGQRIVMPAARLRERVLAPHPRGPVELEEPAAPVASPLLDQEVAVQQESLGARQPGLLLVEVIPAGLHHAYPRVGHRGEEVLDEPGRGNEIGVQYEDVFAGRRGEALGERARLVAVAVGAVVHGDVDASPPPLAGAPPRDGGGVVGGIVEDLDLEEVAGVREAAGGVDEAHDDVFLVVDGELDGDAGGGGRGGGVGRPGGRPPPRQEEQTDPVGRKGQQQGQDTAVERDRDDTEGVGHSDRSLGVGSNPRHRSTGSGGYLGKVGSSR